MNITGNDNYGKPKSEYVERIANLDDDGLLRECEMKIWLSAYAANNPRSDYHWHAEVCYAECVKRDKVDIYTQAWKAAAER